MKNASKEIEMQTYSLSYSYPVTYPTALPYHWDGECHLMLNQSFYAPPPEELAVPELPDQLFSDEEKDEAEDNKAPNFSQSTISPMHFETSDPPKKDSATSVGSVPTEASIPKRDSVDSVSTDDLPPKKESVASIGSVSTEGPSSLGSKPASLDTIDQRLDFILDSVKKQKKPAAVKKPPASPEKKPKLTRKRKTTAQLEMLQREVGENEILDKAKMKELAEKTGLKVGQVYKWYWDYRRKQSGQSSSQC